MAVPIGRVWDESWCTNVFAASPGRSAPDAPPRTLRSFAQGLALLDEAMASPRTKPFAPVTDELGLGRARSVGSPNGALNITGASGAFGRQ